jgi:SAM-dependent methyltransferase
MFDERHWAEVPAVIDCIAKLSGIAPPMGGLPPSGLAEPSAPAVLDTCCGVGRHSIEFALRGYRVTGIDITGPFLEAAEESAGVFGCKPEFAKADLRTFARPAAFDLAVNLFRSFGYFDTQAEDAAALSNIRASLAPGGAFVLETLGKEIAAKEFSEGEWFERDGWTILTEFKVEGAWDGLRHRWVLMRGDERFDRSFVLRLYSGREMREALLAAGFDAVEIYGSLEGAPYDEKAESLVAVARVAKR